MTAPVQTLQSSKQEYGYLVDREVVITARDGTSLATTLYYPARDGKRADGQFPVVMERTPYDRNSLPLHIMGMFFARRGYVFASQDVRGRGDSGGTYAYLYNEHDEGDDGYDAVEWLGTQEWSTGKVGTLGISYTGATQQALAVRRPPHLVTQVLGDTGYNYFLKGTTRHGGAFEPLLGTPYPFWLGKTGTDARRDRRVKDLLARAHENTAELLRHLPLRPGTTALRFAPEYEEWYFNMTTRGEYDEYWKNPGGSLQEFVDDYPDIPVFIFTSWYGHHPWANFVKYNDLRQRLTQPIKLVVGTWIHGYDMMMTTHAGEVEFGLDAALGDLNSIRLKWFDHWLKGYQTDVLDGPPIELFVMGGGSGEQDAAGRMVHGGFWRKVDQWPLPQTESTTYYLHPDGALRSDPPGSQVPPTSYTFNPNDPVPSLGGNVQDVGRPANIAYGGAFDQRGRKNLAFCKDELPLAMRPDVLVFQTEELKEEVEVTGPIFVKLWVSSSAVDTDFTAKLIDVCPPNEDYPDGFAMNLCESIVRMRYRNGFERAELIEPGEVYEITIEPQPTANRFMPGHRIRLDISSSSFPVFEVNRNSGEPVGMERRTVVAHNTIYHDADHPSHVILPIVHRR